MNCVTILGHFANGRVYFVNSKPNPKRRKIITPAGKKIRNITMQSFMNQGSQKDVMNFVSDCLDCDAQLVGGGQQIRPDEEEGTDP